MPSVVFTLTTSVRPPIELTDFVDGLALNPPYVAFNASSDGNMNIDFHSSTSLATPGTGDIQTWTRAVVGGPQIITHDLSALGSETGCFHYYLTKDALYSNKLVTQQVTVPTAWGPEELFLSGEKGALWNFTAFTTYTNNTRLSLAGVGDTIVTAEDLSNNGNHLELSAAGAVLGETGGLQYATFDGSTQLMSAVDVPLDDTDELSLFIIYDMLTVADRRVMRVLSLDPTRFLDARSDSTENQKFASVSAGTERQAFAAPTLTQPMLHVSEAKASTTLVRLTANGTTQTETLDFGSLTNWGSEAVVTVGGRDSGSKAHCRIYAAGVINRLLTSGERSSLQTWAKARGGVSW